MATPVWPSSLPAGVLLEGYNEVAQTPKYSAPTDNSLPIERPKTTLRASKLTVNIDMTDAQLQVFEDFVFYDLGQASSQFMWIHPRLGRQVRAAMIGEEPYGVVKMSPTYWKISMTLMVYP